MQSISVTLKKSHGVMDKAATLSCLFDSFWWTQVGIGILSQFSLRTISWKMACLRLVCDLFLSQASARTPKLEDWDYMSSRTWLQGRLILLYNWMYGRSGVLWYAFYCKIGPFLMHPVIRCIKSLHTKQSVINGVYNPM